MAKKCKACNKEMKGFGDTCSDCRKTKGATAGYVGGGAGSDKCESCGKVAYAMERIQVEGLTFHPSCFKCTHCSNKLSLGNFSKANDGKFYCKTHYMELFKRKGRYSIDKLNDGGVGGFDEAVYKAAWDGAGGDAKKAQEVIGLSSTPKDYDDYLGMCKAGKFKCDQGDVHADDNQAAKDKAAADTKAAQEEEQARRLAETEKAEKDAEDERKKNQEEADKAAEEEQKRRVSETSASPERKRSSFVPAMDDLAAEQAKRAEATETAEKDAQEVEEERKKSQEAATKAMEEEQARRVEEESASPAKKRSSFTPDMAELAAKVSGVQED